MAAKWSGGDNENDMKRERYWRSTWGFFWPSAESQSRDCNYGIVICDLFGVVCSIFVCDESIAQIED
ncbi:hypothetical protein QG37_05023 [Candidozyma auris]|nr:hypothetical protein QG37_05023 [[Candida] auris]